MAAKSAKGDGKGRKAKAQPPVGRHRLARPARKKAVGKAAPAHARTRHPPKKTHAPLPKKASSAQPAAGDKTPLRDDAILRPAGQKFTIGKESILSLGELSKPLDKDETLSSLLPRASQRRQPKVLLSREETRPEHEVAYAEEPAEQPGKAPPEIPKKERQQPVPARKKEKRKERHAAARTEPAAGHPEEPGLLTEEQLSVLEQAPLPKGTMQPELKRKPLLPPPPPPRLGPAAATKPPEPLPELPTGRSEDTLEDMKRAVLTAPQPAQAERMPPSPSPMKAVGKMPSPPLAEEQEQHEEGLPALPSAPSAEEPVWDAINEEKPIRKGLLSFLRRREREVPEKPLEREEEKGEPSAGVSLPPELPIEEFIEESIIKAVSEPPARAGEQEEGVIITHDYPPLPIDKEAEAPEGEAWEEALPAPGPSPLQEEGDMPPPPPAEGPEKQEEGLPALPSASSAEEPVESAIEGKKSARRGLFSSLMKREKEAAGKPQLPEEQPPGALPPSPEPPAEGFTEETIVGAVPELPAMPGAPEEAITMAYDSPYVPFEEKNEIPVGEEQEETQPVLQPEPSPGEEELPPPPPPLLPSEQRPLSGAPEDRELAKRAESTLPDEVKPDRLEIIEHLWEEADQLWRDLRNIPEEDTAFRRDLEKGIEVVERRHKIILPESEEDLEIPDEQEILILREAQEARERALTAREEVPEEKKGEWHEAGTPEEKEEEKAPVQTKGLPDIAEGIRQAVTEKVPEPEEEMPRPPAPPGEEEPIGGFFGEEPDGVLPAAEEQMEQPQPPSSLLELPETALLKRKTGEPPPGEGEATEAIPRAEVMQDFDAFIRKEGLSAEGLRGIRAKRGKKRAAKGRASPAQKRKAAKKGRKAAPLTAAHGRGQSRKLFRLEKLKVASILRESEEADAGFQPQTGTSRGLPPLMEEVPSPLAKTGAGRKEGAGEAGPGTERPLGGQLELEQKRLRERMADEETRKRIEGLLTQLSALASQMRTSLGQKDYAAADQAYQRIRQLKDDLGGRDLGKLGYELVMLEADLKLARLG